MSGSNYDSITAETKILFYLAGFIFYKERLNVDELKSKAVAQVLKTRMKKFGETRLT